MKPDNISLRDYFAAIAMEHAQEYINNDKNFAKNIAVRCYKIADAMLDEQKRGMQKCMNCKHFHYDLSECWRTNFHKCVKYDDVCEHYKERTDA